MSANMGKRLNPDIGHRVDGGRYESPGLPVRQYCPVCLLKKLPGQSHPRCSRIMQQRSRLGDVI